MLPHCQRQSRGFTTKPRLIAFLSELAMMQDDKVRTHDDTRRSPKSHQS